MYNESEFGNTNLKCIHEIGIVEYSLIVTVYCLQFTLMSSTNSTKYSELITYQIGLHK